MKSGYRERCVVLLHKNNTPCHKSVKKMEKIHELDLKRMLACKKFLLNEKMVVETEAYLKPERQIVLQKSLFVVWESVLIKRNLYEKIYFGLIEG